MIRESERNPLFDALFEGTEWYLEERALLAQDRLAYERDVARARRSFVKIQHSSKPFQEWYATAQDRPFFAAPGRVDPLHYQPAGEERVAVEALYLRDPESLLFKEWAREDAEHSVGGTGFPFLAVCYSIGRSHSTTRNPSSYLISLDPKRAAGCHLYGLWARLQEAEFRAQGVVDCPPEPHRPGFAGRKVGPDPWYDGGAYQCTILDTCNQGTALKSGTSAGLEEMSPDAVEGILKLELEFAWYETGDVTGVDAPLTEGDPVRWGPVKVWGCGHSEVSASNLRFAQVALDAGLDPLHESLGIQIGRQLWTFLETPGVGSVPADFQTRHLVRTAHAITVWNRGGLVVGYRDDAGRRAAHRIREAVLEIADLSKGMAVLLGDNSAPEQSDAAAASLQRSDLLIRKVARLKHLTTGSDGRVIREFLTAVGFDSLIDGLHNLNHQSQNLRLHEAMTRSAEEVRDSVRAIEEMQGKVEWVEVFLVAVYSVYLVNYLGENFRFAHDYVGYSILLGSGLAAGLTALALQPWKHSKPLPSAPAVAATTVKPHGHGELTVDPAAGSQGGANALFKALIRTRTRLLLCIITALAVYLALGFLFFQTDRERSDTPSAVIVQPPAPAHE